VNGALADRLARVLRALDRLVARKLAWEQRMHVRDVNRRRAARRRAAERAAAGGWLARWRAGRR
jgi:hypothetical protein